MLNQDVMREATRLTRAGQLVEATALLQRMLRGETAPDMTFPNGGDMWRKPPLIVDAKVEMIGEADRPRLSRVLPAELPTPCGSLHRAKRRSGPDRRGIAPRAPLPTPDILPEGARFIAGAYSNPAGSRAYKLYIPSRDQGQPLPLVVMLHGCTQSPDDFATGTRMNNLAEEHTFLVAYPAQARSANVSKCWNWFSEGHQQRDRGEPSLIAGITRRIMHEFPIESGRVYIAGLSAGGAAAAILGNTHPDLYAGIGVHSGLACGAARDIPSAFAAMRHGGAARPVTPRQCETIVPTIVFHGDADKTVNSVNSDQIISQSGGVANLATKVTHGTAAGGMHYTRTIQTDETGRTLLEQWKLHGAGHAWSGGSAAGSYTDPRGPDASREMVRFFLNSPR
jgi:poly(hydroxyalkanoate) depolymerase family esterase